MTEPTLYPFRNKITDFQKNENYNPPSNFNDFCRWHEKRQKIISIDKKYITYMLGTQSSSIKFLENYYKVTIDLQPNYIKNTTKFIIRDKNWLILTDKKNKVNKCVREMQRMLSNIIENEKMKEYGCKSCMVKDNKFKIICRVCKKKKGCIYCLNENGCYNNICEECGRNNCCPTCLRIDGTVIPKCSDCNR